MITIEGKSVFGGVSIGKLMFYKRNEKVIRRTHVDDVDAEWKRFEEAKNTAIDQLKDLYDKAIEDVGEANAMIFEIHQMMLDDLDYLESIEGIIRTQSVNAEYAVSTTADNFAQMFASMDDAYMQGRAADVKDVSERVLDILCGVSNGTREMTEPCIVAADDLAPSETVQLDKEKVLGFATMYGSSNSHTAILARTMNIPAVIGMGEALNPKYDGEMAIIDGFTGTLYVDPDEETLAKMQEKRAKDLEQKELLNQLKGKENVTKSGQKINVYANIGNVSDLGAVLKNDAGGVGLFRSEFLYLENSTYPTEEQQFAAYRQVVEIRHCTVEDICQRIFRDRVNFFAVIYFHITVIAGLISHINGKRLLYRLCFLFFLGILHSNNCIRIVKSILGIVGAVIIYKFIVCQRSYR